jgi:very-short-patch-repair endonuclease
VVVVAGDSPFVGTEALKAGRLTERELQRSCTRIYRNVYQRRGAELSAKDRALAAWLWSDKQAVVAGISAAALLGAKWVDPQAPAELIADRKRPPPLIITRNETLLAGETTMAAGVLVTSPARTAFDLGRRRGLNTAVVRIDALARATGMTVEDVEPVIDTHRGARGIKQLRRVLPLVDAGAESPQETRTRLLLIAGGLPRPQTQIVVRDYRIDMGWEEWLVGVEYDGAQHWTDPRIRANDIERTVKLERRGWILIRVSADLLRHRPHVIVARAREALRARGYRESATADAFLE